MPTTTATTTATPTDTYPHALAPDTAAPDTAAPDTAAPDTAAPDTAAPDTAAPDTAAPDTAAPDTAAPGAAGHTADSSEAHGTAADGPAGDSAARLARAGEVEDRVWAALRRHPGTTAAELAAEASASRSAVAKLLAAWAADGSATSTPGAKPRAARRWTAAPTRTTATEPVATVDTAAPESSSAPENGSADEAAARTPDRAARRDAINAEIADAISAPNADGGIANATAETEDGSLRDGGSHEGSRRGADHEDEAAPGSAKADDPCSSEGHDEAHNDEVDDSEAGVDDTERDGTATAGAEGGAPTQGAGRATGGGSGRPRTPTRNRSGSTRLGKGALRRQVEDYLAETPGEHSPVEIGKVLGRSSGAIANALESLVESGDAARTSDRPRRYSHAEHADDVDRTGSDSSGVSDGAAPDRGRTRTRGPGRGVCGVGTYVTVLAVLPLDSTGAISTDEIADWVRARMPDALFASAAHGVTRAAMSAGADPSDWPTTTTDGTATGGTAADGGTTDDAAADPTAGEEGEQPHPRAESGVGA